LPFLLLLVLAVVYPMRRVLPGVQSMGVDLGGKTRSQAAVALQEHWLNRTVRLNPSVPVPGAGEWTFAPAALGLEIDLEHTVDAAFETGRTFDRLGARIRGKETLEIEPVLIYDRASAREQLGRLKPQIDLEPAPASLRFVDGRVEVVPGRPGREFDMGATARALQGAPGQVVQDGSLELVVWSLDPPEVNLAPFVEQANAWLGNTLVIELYEPINGQSVWWPVAPQQWSEWISLTVAFAHLQEAVAAPEWRLDVHAARAALEAQLAAWTASGQVDPTVYVNLDGAAEAVREAVLQARWVVQLRAYHHGSQYTVRSGDTLASISREVGIPYPWLQQANPGVSDDLHVGQVIQVPSPDVMLPLPVIANKRIVVSIGRQRMWAYQDGTLVWEWVVSTGIPSSPTAPGVFQVQSHDGTAYAASWDLWMPHFLGIYRPVPTSDFMNGFHGFPTRDGASLLWTGNLGQPVTFGCILLETGNAALLYDWAEDGVVVEIQE
jgi:LysM repeat protein